MKKRNLIKLILFCFLFIFVLNFIPVKFALKDINDKTVFINQPKLGNNIEWAAFKYDKGKINYDIIEGYVICGKSPNNVLSKTDFNKTDLYLIKGDNTNKFCIYYDERNKIMESKIFPVYKITAKGWDILYPISRASFRRYCTPKSYLTVYDYNWINVLGQLFKFKR